MNATLVSGIQFALDIALKATLVFAAAEIALAKLRRAPAATRHFVASAGLVAALALPLLSVALPRVPLPVLPSLPAAAAPDVRVDSPAVISEEADPVPAAALEAAPTAPVAESPATGGVPWLALVLSAWAGGAVLAAVRLAVGWARVRRIAREADPIHDADWTVEREAACRRLGVRRPVALLESPQVPVAMTSGLLRPLLLLGRAARTWAVERRRIVLLHELAHVRRGDWLTLILAETAAALYWFHPAAWHLARRVRREAEQAADDLVIESGTKPSVYAGHLLGIFRSLSTVAHPVAPALAIARPSHFEGRLRAILDSSAARREMSPTRARLAVAGVFAAAALAALVEPWAPSQANAALPRPYGDDDASVAKVSIEAAPEPRPEPGRTLPAIWKVQPESKPGFVRASNGGDRWARRSGSAWYSRAMDLHNDERYDEAIEAFEKAIEAGYREGASSYNIACGYSLKGDKNRAFEWLGKAMDAGFDVASYLGRDDDLDNLRSDPRWKDLKKTARNKESSRHEDEDKAVAARYERLVARAPRGGEPFFEIGKELLNADRYDLSARAFQAAADRGYRVGTSLYNEACALSRGNNKSAALDLLQKALDAGFDQPDIFRRDDDLGNVRDEKRFAEIAREARDLELPGYSTDRWSFGSSWSRSKWREAAKKFEEYTRAHPQKGRGWFNLGFASLASNRPEAAADAFQKALDLNYRKPTTMYNLACSYARLEQKDKAFDWLFKALDAGFES
ncbi:MAG: TPR end-of-group domain-containing protein, partial [Thermoanaerobaculia bacterium]